MKPHWVIAVCLAGGTPLVAQTMASSQLKIAPSAQHESCLSWQAAMLRPYQIESSPDLASWADFGTMHIGNDDLKDVLVPRQAARAFYRLRIGAVRPGFDTVAMSRGDDHTYPQYVGSAAVVNLGFPIRLFNKTYTACYVNNNGNITFEAPLFVYTPESLIKKQAIMIAPFWADVDSRNSDSNVTRFSSQPTPLDGHPAFGVTWRNVGYFSQHVEKLNTFQLLLIERGDRNPGDFDIEFNYNQIEWETGDASGGSSGLGGSAARVGWTNGLGLFMELRGSGESLALLDRKPDASTPNFAQGLIYQRWNSPVPGRVVIPVVNGIPESEQGLAFQMEAGPDLALANSDGRSFALAGSISPPDTAGVSFSWVQESGPADAMIASPGLLNSNVLIPEPGTYVFCLRGTKNGAFLASSSDSVTVTHPGLFEVNAGYYSRPASAPLAVVLSDAYARFNGQNVTAIQWLQLEGDKASIQSPNQIHPTVNLPSPGYYRFQCRASTNHTPAFVKIAEAVVVFGD
jgi:hypothetical protein